LCGLWLVKEDRVKAQNEDAEDEGTDSEDEDDEEREEVDDDDKYDDEDYDEYPEVICRNVEQHLYLTQYISLSLLTYLLSYLFCSQYLTLSLLACLLTYFLTYLFCLQACLVVCSCCGTVELQNLTQKMISFC